MEKKQFMNKKGNAMSHPLVIFIVGFFGVGFIAAIYVVIIGALYSSTAATNLLPNGSWDPNSASVIALNVLNNTDTLFTNFTGQFGTIGLVGGILLLLVLVAAAGIGAAWAYKRFN